MKLSISIESYHLKIFSTVCSNLIVVWIIGALAAQNIFVLTSDIVAAILAWYMAVWAERELERHYES